MKPFGPTSHVGRFLFPPVDFKSILNYLFRIYSMINMPRTLDKQYLTQQALALLAATPAGMDSPSLQQALNVSQPTVSRLLRELRARGLVVSEGSARATRYHAVQGRLDIAALRSRLLHEQIAHKLLRQPQALAKVKKRLQQLESVNPAGRPYHKRWASLMQGPLPGLLRKMTEDSEEAALLRKESPFTVMLTPEERKAVFRRVNAGRRT